MVPSCIKEPLLEIKKPRMVHMHVTQVKGFFWRETAHAGAPYYSLITITMSKLVKEYHHYTSIIYLLLTNEYQEGSWVLQQFS